MHYCCECIDTHTFGTLLNSRVSAYRTCYGGKVYGPTWSTWGTSLGEDKFGARASIINTNVARRANIPPHTLMHCSAEAVGVDAKKAPL